jgi:DNA topoisomerase-1
MRLRRSDPNQPGYTRRRRGRGFSYTTATGEPLTDPAELARIRALVIPPAWQQVWICPDPRGHIQAVGIDAAGRRQYRYHEVWRAKRDAAKFDHVLDVGRRLPRIRRRVGGHLQERGLSRNRVMATAVRLLDLGCFRIGGEEYATGDDATFGLATLQCEHVELARGGAVRFSYPAKGGAQRDLEIRDEQVRTVLRALLSRTPAAPRLFAYRGAGGWTEVRSKDINEYLSEISGVDITAKDFRTWHGTVLAALVLGADELTATAKARSPGKRSATARKRAVRTAMREVAEYLGNTPATARASYVDPRVVDLFLDGVTIAPALDQRAGTASADRPVSRRAAERALLELLEDPAKHRPSRRTG